MNILTLYYYFIHIITPHHNSFFETTKLSVDDTAAVYDDTVPVAQQRATRHTSHHASNVMDIVYSNYSLTIFSLSTSCLCLFSIVWCCCYILFSYNFLPLSLFRSWTMAHASFWLPPHRGGWGIRM